MSAISIKTEEEIEKMRVAGKLAADTLDHLQEYVKVGNLYYVKLICI